MKYYQFSFFFMLVSLLFASINALFNNFFMTLVWAVSALLQLGLYILYNYIEYKTIIKLGRSQKQWQH